ncbi:hypothetical protein LSAT2_030157 [Lamellibrachia satsuma]|nr:hypothetical protein LSAT2_030157 [Lamellibrachia satsuma]
MVRIDLALGQLTDLSDVLSAVWSIDYMAGDTNTADAIAVMRDMFNRSRRRNVKQIAILITDGTPGLNAGQTVPNANLASDDGIEIFAIGIGAEIDLSVMEAIVTNPTYYYIWSGSHNGITNEIIEMTCVTRK